MHLEYLHLQILSVLTATQLRRIFERRTNFDLRRLLEGEAVLDFPVFSFTHVLLPRHRNFSSYPDLSSAVDPCTLYHTVSIASITIGIFHSKSRWRVSCPDLQKRRGIGKSSLQPHEQEPLLPTYLSCSEGCRSTAFL